MRELAGQPADDPRHFALAYRRSDLCRRRTEPHTCSAVPPFKRDLNLTKEQTGAVEKILVEMETEIQKRLKAPLAKSHWNRVRRSLSKNRSRTKRSNDSHRN